MAKSENTNSIQAGILVWGETLATLSEALVPFLIVRLLGPAEVGIFQALFALYIPFATILAAGFPNSVMYFLPTRTAGARRDIVRRIMLSLLGLGCLYSVLLLAFPLALTIAPQATARFFEGGRAGSISVEDGVFFLQLLALYPLTDLPCRLLPKMLVVEGRASSSAWISVFKSIGRSLSVMVPMALGYELHVVVISITVFGYLYAGIMLSFYFSIYKGAQREQTEVGYYDLFRFAIPLGLTDAVGVLGGYLDKYLIILMFTASQFAVYSIGAWQIPMLTAIAYTVGTAFAPKYSQLFKENKPQEAIDLWRYNLLQVSLIVVPISTLFIVMSEEVMEVFFTESYLGSANVFRAYTFLTLGRVTAFGSILIVAGKPSYVFQSTLFSVFCNIVLSVPLLFTVGFLGPAIGTALAFIPMAVFYCWSISRATGIPFKGIFPLLGYAKVLGVAAIAASLGLMFKLFVSMEALPSFLIVTVILLGSYGILGTLFRIIKKDDWTYLLDWVRFKVFKDEKKV